MTVTAAEFITNYPELGCNKTAPIESLIARADNYWSKCNLGTMRDEVIQLWVAHNLVLRNRQAAALQSGGSAGTADVGPVRRRSVRDVSVEFVVPKHTESAAGAFYSQTVYGQDLWQMIAATVAPVMVVHGKSVSRRPC